MKLFNSQQTKILDTSTAQEDGMTSWKLMERASQVFADWFVHHEGERDKDIHVIAGMGNNGGDALGVARLLFVKGYKKISVHIIRYKDQFSSDAQRNFELLPSSITIEEHDLKESHPEVTRGIVIDGLLGSGITRPLGSELAELVRSINDADVKVYSIDLPSGMFPSELTTGISMQACHTLAFEYPKLAFFFQENHVDIGEWTFRSIGLSKDKKAELPTAIHYIDDQLAKTILMQRQKHSYKGDLGHACMIVGSEGMYGAGILATHACMRSGVGLVSYQIPAKAEIIYYSTLPEAMCLHHSGYKHIQSLVMDQRITSYGIGCGMGQHSSTVGAFLNFLEEIDIPVVLDADALNIISNTVDALELIPPQSIITPHIGEFRRLFGVSENSFERHQKQVAMSIKWKINIVLKGPNSCITTPEGDSYFNSSGNPGLATAGTGDVLTGLVTGLLAQGYSASHAAILGVYLHGLSADLCILDSHMHSLTASDVIDHIGQGYQHLETIKN